MNRYTYNFEARLTIFDSLPTIFRIDLLCSLQEIELFIPQINNILASK